MRSRVLRLSAAADPLDRGRRYRELMGQNNWSLRRLARELRLTPATVSAALRIAEAGPEILQRLRAGQITQSEALAAVRTADPKTLTAGSILGRSKKNQRGTRQSYSTADGTRIQVLHRRRIGAAEDSPGPPGRGGAAGGKKRRSNAQISMLKFGR